MHEGFFRAVSTAELVAMLRTFAPLPVETLDLDAAAGRYLAEDVVSGENLPAADRASMQVVRERGLRSLSRAAHG